MKKIGLKYTTIFTIGGLSFVFGAFASRVFERVPITPAIVLEAQKVIGFNFTQPQADSMLNNLNQWNVYYERFRALKMPNSIVPALSFNPIPVGFVPQDKTNGFVLGKTATVKLPADKNELAFFTVRQLAELIRTKQITSVELTKFYIDRLKKYDPKLLFIVTLTEELALKQAGQADAEIKAGKYKGVLHGIPYGVKDLLATNGYKTTFGAVPFKDQTIDMDATVVTKLEQAGAVLCAKLTLGELAQGDVWFGGKTKNPWDTTRGSSGSSAGPASAVSAGCLPFAIGSETLGSIVSPSTECGDTGLRPSFGRISKFGAMALSWSMDKLGPITRSVEDAAIVFNAIQGTDPNDLSTIAANFNYNGNVKSLKGYKIGYTKADFERKSQNQASDSLTLVKLKELGAELIPIDYPREIPTSSMGIILSAEAGAAFQHLLLDGRTDGMVLQRKSSWPNTFRSAQFIPAVEYIQANRARTMLIQAWYEKLKGLDLYVSPSLGNLNLNITNLTGNPCVVLPNGFNPQGRPMSITFTGQLFGEGKLLQAAQAYQTATDFHTKHPALNF
ncbi:amidase [Mucilaginibacter myungsuensis]|uniref:Amidase n=1 Tax=Mucilaginibacter myungsuensis TaxID=649104 RepID=A0A929KZH9_9SPHI|nr:amidase [Mucilaginibacter myungsuensis]MBE9664062.1 amidase [Mucilaginibacter myungsuensis]MDN3601240.1 amidase [Mucilaginibacter myungsuensis]